MIERDVDLAPFNTLRLPGYTKRYCRLTAASQLAGLPDGPRFVLGGGSNLLLAGNFEGLVIHMALTGKHLLQADHETVLVEAAAGENWHDFVEWTLSQGWPGLENLALIPGQVGAAPVQNIGAYGLEAGERIAEVRAWDSQARREVHFSRAECRFGYRHSVFKQHGWHLDGRMIITSVVFRLPREWRPNLAYADLARELAADVAPSPQRVADAVIAIRRRKLPDPAHLPNAGSFFENPIVDAEAARKLQTRYPDLPAYAQPDGRFKLAAGWMIERAGWKGRDLGAVGMYEKQALVLVHRGGGTGVDALRLVSAVQDAVEAMFGVRLKPEPVVLGRILE